MVVLEFSADNATAAGKQSWQDSQVFSGLAVDVQAIDCFAIGHPLPLPGLGPSALRGALEYASRTIASVLFAYAHACEDLGSAVDSTVTSFDNVELETSKAYVAIKALLEG